MDPRLMWRLNFHFWVAVCLFFRSSACANRSHEIDLIFMRMNIQVTFIYHGSKSQLGIGLFIHELAQWTFEHYRSRSITHSRRFDSKDALSIWTNLGKHLFLVWLFASSIKTATGHTMRVDELSFVIRLERRNTKDSSSGRIMRLVPVFIVAITRQTKNVFPSSSRRIKCL